MDSSAPAASRPLDGITVLDLGQIYSGPYCTLLLAYLGAEVIKVEPIGGEHTRERVTGQESHAYVMLGSSKQAICVNLKHEAGRELFLGLVSQADVVVENFARGTMDRLGLGFEQLQSVNPGIVLASAKGFNADSPLSRYLAMDLTVQAMTSILSVTGFPENPPVKAGAAISDMMGGVTLALGVVAALFQRERTGQGQHVEVAMQDALIPTLASNLAAYFEAAGERPERTGNRHGGLAVAPYNVYQCGDGWIAILCARDRQWKALLAAMGREDLLDDERFETVATRAAHIDAVDQLVGAWTAGWTRDRLVDYLVESSVPCAPVRTLAELAEDDFQREHGMLPEIDHRTLGRVRVFGNPISMSGAEPVPITAAPLLGQDTDSVLSARLGLDHNKLRELRESGAIG